MIKATDLIKKETIIHEKFYFKIKNNFEIGNNTYSLKESCIAVAQSFYIEKYNNYITDNITHVELEKLLDEREDKIIKLAARLEREFLRANKKPKFIILYGCTELVNMNIYAWDTGTDTPYYENAVLESKEEARKVAESENLQSFIIVEVSNEN